MKVLIYKIFIFFIFIILSSSFVLAIEGRWAIPKNIPTYIQSGHKNTIMMKHAFAEWTRLTKEKIIFKYVNNPKLAKIEVYFVNKIDNNKSSNLDRAIGLTETGTINGTKIVHAKIWIADKTQNNKTLNRDEVYTVMLHEIGHSIGLNHSKNPKSVMYYGVNVIQEIEKSDLTELNKIYGW